LDIVSEARVSQSSKRPGAKDISDLKARLGLKKSSPAGAGPGGVIAPPGSRSGGVIPAPPGVGPQRPAIPDAKEDPFAAMNAIAAHGARTAQPAYVVPHDIGPVERVEKRSNAFKLGVLGGILLVPLVLGVVIGVLAAKARAYNRTIDDAVIVREDTNKVRDGLIAIQQVLQTGRERSRGAQGFVVGDAKLTADLAGLPPLTPNIEKVFRTHLYELEPQLVAAILSFYVEAIELNNAIKSHIAASKDADRILKEGQVKMMGFNPAAYAGLVEMPTAEEASAGKPIMLKIVQLGSPVCEGETKPSDKPCPGQVSAFRYRPDELSVWGVKKMAQGTTLDTDGLIVLDRTSKVLQQLAKGGAATIAEAGYTERINRINDTVGKLLQSQEAIQGHLNNHANKSKQFTFFL
jgi:hypothetical protein